jgi:hypothetical protein
MDMLLHTGKTPFFVIRETLLNQAALRKVGGPFVLFSLNVKLFGNGEHSHYIKNK